MNRSAAIFIAVIALVVIGIIILVVAFTSKDAVGPEDGNGRIASGDGPGNGTSNGTGGSGDTSGNGGGASGPDEGPGENGGGNGGNGGNGAGNGGGETSPPVEVPEDIDPIDDPNAIGIRGTVVNAEGEPIEMATVMPFNFAKYEMEDSLTTMKDGRFFIPAAAGDVYYLRAYAHGYSDALVKAVSPQEAKLVLEKGGSISGKVTDAATQEPVTSYTIFLNRMPFNPTEMITGARPFSDVVQTILLPDQMKGCCMESITSDTGEYSVSGLSPGMYTIAVVAGEYKVTAKGDFMAGVITLGPGEEKTGVDIALEKAGIVKGTVIDDRTEVPVAGAVLTPVAGLCDFPPLFYDLTDVSVTTGPDGRFELYSSEEYREAVRVTHPDYGERVVQRSGKKGAGWTIRLGDMCTIKGKVYDYLRNLMPGGRVILIDKNAGPRGQMEFDVADSEGNYAFEGISPGLYVILRVADIAKGQFSMNDEDKIEIKAGEVVEYDIGLKGSTLTGVVYNRGKPAPGVMVFVVPVVKGEYRDGSDVFGSSDPDGRYVIGGIASGSYYVKIGSFFGFGRGDDEKGEEIFVPEDTVIEHDFKFNLGKLAWTVIEFHFHPAGREIRFRYGKARDL